MKEVTSILTLKITSINKMSAEKADEFVKGNQERETQQSFCEFLKKELCVDDVVVEQVQDFVREVEECENYSHSKLQ